MMPATLPSALILDVGHDPGLLKTRALVLRSAGYIVDSVSSIADAFDRFRMGDFDLITLCHSLREDEREHLVYLIREHGSHVPLIFIAADCESYLDKLPDSTVGSNPKELLRCLNEVLQRERSAHGR